MKQDSEKRKENVRVVLTVAGSDNSGGAGIQADLKTMSRIGVYGCSAVTCVVAENPGQVLHITPVPASRVLDQIRLTAEAFPLSAMKTGMLYSQSVIAALISWRKSCAEPPPMVVDPVMVATSGAMLLKPSAIRRLSEGLLPLAECVTPNLDEASVLMGRTLKSLKDVEAAALEAYRRWGVPFLIKGGHLGGNEAVDVLFDGERMVHLRAKRVARIHTHGTGCTFSAALACGLAHGLSLVQAARRAKTYTSRAIKMHFQLGRYTPLNHIQ